MAVPCAHLLCCVIVPGGTANVLSVELGIPADQTQATQLLGGVPNRIRPLDMGALVGGNPDGDLMFFHLGIGMEGSMHQEADREAKDRSGMLAYVTAALKTLSNPTPAHYRMVIDGETVEADVPAGKHKFAVWHEGRKLGDYTVEVVPDQTAPLEITITAADLARAEPSAQQRTVVLAP